MMKYIILKWKKLFIKEIAGNWSTFCKMDHNPDFKWTLWSTGWKGKNSICWNLLEVFTEWGGLDCHQPILKLYKEPSGTVWFQRSGNDETPEFFRWWRKKIDLKKCRKINKDITLNE